MRVAAAILIIAITLSIAGAARVGFHCGVFRIGHVGAVWCAWE